MLRSVASITLRSKPRVLSQRIRRLESTRSLDRTLRPLSKLGPIRVGRTCDAHSFCLSRSTVLARLTRADVSVNFHTSSVSLCSWLASHLVMSPTVSDFVVGCSHFTRMQTLNHDRPLRSRLNSKKDGCVGRRCDKDSCRIQVPSKPHVCPELYTAEDCDVPGTGYVRMDREKPSKLEDKLRVFYVQPSSRLGRDRIVHIHYQTVHICYAARVLVATPTYNLYVMLT